MQLKEATADAEARWEQMQQHLVALQVEQLQHLQALLERHQCPTTAGGLVASTGALTGRGLHPRPGAIRRDPRHMLRVPTHVFALKPT